MKTVLLATLSILVLFSFEACTHKPIIPDVIEEPPCPTDSVKYSLAADIRPLLVSNNCMTCHNSTNARFSGGGRDLEIYDSLKVLAGNGVLLCSIKHGDDCVPMPYSTGTKISEDDIAIIESWVNACALDN